MVDSKLATWLTCQLFTAR